MIAMEHVGSARGRTSTIVPLVLLVFLAQFDTSWAGTANQSSIVECINQTYGESLQGTFNVSELLTECREHVFGHDLSSTTYIDTFVTTSSFVSRSVLEICSRFNPNTTLHVSDLFVDAVPLTFGLSHSDDAEPVLFEIRDASTGTVTNTAVADPRSGNVTFLGNIDSESLLELWATDGLGREVIVWRWLITPVVRSLAWDAVRQFVPQGSVFVNENITYEFWDPSAGPVRTKWALHETYYIAPILIEGLRLTTDNSSVHQDEVSFIVDPNPVGFFVDSSTGEMLGVPRLNLDGTAFNESVHIYISYDGILTPVATHRFEFLPADESISTNGPNEQGCLNGGNVVDDIEFDSNFTCSCPGVYYGDNCEKMLQSASTSSSDHSSMTLTVAIVSSVAGVLLLLFVVLGIKRTRAYLKSRSPHDFADDVSELDRLGLTTADGPIIPVELKRNRVKIVGDKILGKGEFGMVAKAQVASSEFDTDFDVAVKVLKTDPTAEEQQELMREAFITAQFKHPNVISLVGVVTVGRPMLVVLQLCEKGSLKSLLEKEGDSMDASDLAFFCRGVADGMDYLAGRKFLHRDLAARNVLVDSANVPKVADFGLSRDLEDSEYYRSDDANAKVPLRWTAPEAIKMQYYSEASDVWAFGVTCIEIYTRGATPYRGWMNSYVLERVEGGYRLPQPDGCPPNIYEHVIYPCFDSDPNMRPRFAELKTALREATATLRRNTSDSLMSKFSGTTTAFTATSGYIPAAEATSGQPRYLQPASVKQGHDYRKFANFYEYAEDSQKAQSVASQNPKKNSAESDESHVYYEAPVPLIINNTGYVNQKAIDTQSATSY